LNEATKRTHEKHDNEDIASITDDFFGRQWQTKGEWVSIVWVGEFEVAPPGNYMKRKCVLFTILIVFYHVYDLAKGKEVTAGRLQLTVKRNAVNNPPSQTWKVKRQVIVQIFKLI
jgi:hypothetical protein